MHPVGSMLLGLVAVFLFAIGGQVGEIGLKIVVCLGAFGALLPIPHTRGVNAWVIAPFSFQPALVVSSSLTMGLEPDELKAVLAHETWHFTLTDRAWRLAACLLGACTAPTIALVMLHLLAPALWQLLGLLVVLVLAMAIHAKMLRQSEFWADAEAFRIVGTHDPLRRAILKLDRAAKEVRGFSAAEKGRSSQELHVENLRILGGMEAVPQFTVHLSLLNLSLEGAFIASLVDRHRTVGQICEAAEIHDSGYTAFIVCRILAQLKQSGVVESAIPPGS